ncbi:hypothetical protein TW95_gp1798 [Pandoravirus inopinatum]|uniref:DUF5860 domain-containing protein n=1 Tax=Pandoravirus inopinatum TaxID=1605721 RepID=A0A0B5JFA8_9VIRU|nr:hypothetical protein TW95_gp1798 [Pandoravirus inopinatum]AJF98532.1 hypothetical protein [Pandoravirus inopinatum]
MNTPNSTPASDAAPVVCASYLEALYPAIRAKEAIAAAASIDAALGDIPRRWQTESVDDRGCESVPLLADKIAVDHFAHCIRAMYREGIARDPRPRHIVLALHSALGPAWIDYACLLDEASMQHAVTAHATDRSATCAGAPSATAAATPHGATNGSTACNVDAQHGAIDCVATGAESCVNQGSDAARETRLMLAGGDILDSLARVSIVASIARLPETFYVDKIQGHVVPIFGDTSDGAELVRIIAGIISRLVAATIADKRSYDIVIYADVKNDLLWCHLVPTSVGASVSTTITRVEMPTKSTGLDAKKSRCTSTTPTADSVPSAVARQDRQSPAEIVALYPHLSAAQAAKALLMESALGDVPHYWTQKAADGMAFSAVEPEGATEAALVDRVRFISTTYAKGCHVALTLSENAQSLTIVVPRPPSSPKRQTIDDLLDLYTTLTGREAILLNNVLYALALVPMEWVADASGHTFDNNGPFVRGSKMVDDVQAAYAKAKSETPDCHVVLSLHRVDNAFKDLVYSFIVLPTA